MQEDDRIYLMDEVPDFRAALTWLEQEGVPTNRGRLQEYARVCHQLETASVDLTLVLNTRCFEEIGLIVQIWRNAEALRELGDLRQRLKWICGGRSSHAHDADRTARNYLFELVSACWLLSNDFKLMRSLDGDIAAEWQGRRFLVECKRPSTEKALVRDVRAASKQLRQRRGDIGRQIGLVLIDFTLLIDPEHRSPLVESPVHLMSMLETLMDQHARHYMDLVTPQLRSRHDVFVGGYFSVSGWDKRPGASWSFARRWVAYVNPRASRMDSMSANSKLVAWFPRIVVTSRIARKSEAGA
jgi:hypothetical protein